MLTGSSPMDLMSTKSTGSRIYETLRNMILTQELKPGERLVEAKIASLLNVSITPVRQAFSFLATQGLLTVFPYRGTYVTILTQESAQDLMNVRKALEPVAASMAFSGISYSDADYLTKLCELADLSRSMGELVESIEYDVRFHEYFFQKSNSQLMLELWNVLRNRLIFLQCIMRPNCEVKMPSLVLRHKEMIEAVRALDLPLLQASIIKHLDTTLRNAQLPLAADIHYGE